MAAKEITDLGGRILPRIMEMVPADEEGHMTKIEYLSLDFSKPIKESFFSVRNMQKVR